MTKLCVSEWIDAEPGRVFEVMRSPECARDWMPGLTAMVVEPPGPLEAGSKIRETRKMFGKEHTVEFDVVSVEEGRRIDLAAIDCGVSYHFAQEVVRENGGTRLTLDGTIAGGGFFARTMMKIMGTGMMRKALAKDLAALKAYVEGESR
ncbi:MAG: SRPBCC family protein [Phycisphaeraceae bacterium]|nr:SRPBCC family protein [Phycisphaerales bacterium]MCB9842693.1 SRPBCC family protein [Phycisphaeraceae bacterium]